MEGPEASSTDLIVYVAPGLRARATQWSEMAADERRRGAMAAANAHDAGALAELTVAYLLLHGRQHAAASDHTIRSYAVGVRRLLLEWDSENILHPSPDAGDRYIASLSMGHAPATCSARLAAAAALYRALHWARATTADPFAGVRPASLRLSSVCLPAGRVALLTPSIGNCSSRPVRRHHWRKSGSHLTPP